MSFATRVKENPMMSIMSIIVLLGASIGAIGTMHSGWDDQHTTKTELEEAIAFSRAMISSNQTRIDNTDRRSRCSNIDVKITIVEDQIWNMEQSTPGVQRLVDKKRELRNLLEKRSSLNCSDFD